VTDSIDWLAEATEHLRKSPDEKMSGLVEQFGELDYDQRRRGRPADAYGALLRSIIGQQLSVKAARSIFGRFTELYGGRTPTPAEILETDPETLRSVGFSRAKANYVRDLAAKVEAGDLHLDGFEDMSDERVIEELTQVKGLGRWTADVFLMFHLGRPDVLPVGDQGIRRAVERLYGLEEIPDAETLERLGERWAPYRTLASLYLWESLDNTPD
jgi:DNA-3-methyladenine glycosylase II